MHTNNKGSEKMNQKEVNIATSSETRKAAFAAFNRDVNFKNVAVIQEKIQEKGYRVGEPIQVLKAEYALSHGISALFNIYGSEIATEEISNYFLVVDGHHRTFAVMQFNDWAERQGKETINIPAIEVELIKGETVTEYSNEINCTKKEWSKEDYVNGAASVFPNEELLQKYNELIKTESNPKGFSLSTLNLIYCNGKGLTKKDLVLLCSGATHKGVNAKQNIIPAHNIEIGNNFISICTEKGFKTEEIAKRYLISEFNNIRNSIGTELAIKVINSITLDDISTMSSDQGKLNEQKVIDHFVILVQRNR